MSSVSEIDMGKYLLVERGSPELFRGSKEADALFLGQDPTILSPRHIPFVLDLKNPNGQLNKYIFGKICRTLKLNKERILAWNLVNRFFCEKPSIIANYHQVELFLNNKFPYLTGCQNDWRTVRFLYFYFIEFGKQELEYVINKYIHLNNKKGLLISLGEPVFRILRHSYAIPQGINIPENLAEFCCEKTFRVNIGSSSVEWLALPHEPTGDHNPYYKRVLLDKLPRFAEKI